MTVGTCLASLFRDVCMQWTIEANGPHGEDDEDRDHRPTDWNIHFFDFLGVLAVNLSNEQLVSMFLEPMSRFRDEPFYDAIGAFLRGFDRATVATDTRDPENPAAVRSLVADRIRRGWGFKRLTREKIWSAETHLGDALNALFYQPSNWANRNQQPHIPRRWEGLLETMPTLTALVTEAPASGWLVYLFLNLVESFPCAALLPFVVHATGAWCSVYGADTNFWLERWIGARVCAWIEKTLDADDAAAAVLIEVQDELTRCLDILVRSGVAQARETEERIQKPIVR
jgi:hypothetical protein